jgi:hypothetical protein
VPEVPRNISVEVSENLIIIHNAEMPKSTDSKTGWAQGRRLESDVKVRNRNVVRFSSDSSAKR